MALPQRSERDEAECSRCLRSHNADKPLLELWKLECKCFGQSSFTASPYRSAEYHTVLGIPHGCRHRDSSATTAPQLQVAQFALLQGVLQRVRRNPARLLAPEAPGSEPPTNLGSTGHAHHAIGRCAHNECGVSNVGDGWSRLGVHLAEGRRGAASSRAGVRTWLLRRARKARGVPALAPMPCDSALKSACFDRA